MKYLIFSLLIALVAVVFAVQNSMVVNVSFLTFTFETSLVIIILAATATGVIVACPPALFAQYKLSRQIKKLEAANKTLESENKRLQDELTDSKKPLGFSAEITQEKIEPAPKALD